MELDERLSLQHGIITRRQALAAELTPHDVRRRLRRREWVIVHPGVYVNHTGPLTWLQRAWAAVLAMEPAALCGPSALRAARGPGRRGEDDDVIHVAIDRDRKREAMVGVRVHRMAQLSTRVRWNTSPPRLHTEEAALDLAIAAGTEFEAVAFLAEVVQSRRTTASRIREALDERPWAPRRSWLGDVLADIADGTCSVLEREYLHRVELAHGLPTAERQVRAQASVGVVYRDAAYADGLLVELDGRLARAA